MAEEEFGGSIKGMGTFISFYHFFFFGGWMVLLALMGGVQGGDDFAEDGEKLGCVELLHVFSSIYRRHASQL